MKALRRTAIDWFIRLQKMDAEHPDRGRFEAWLMADPSHQQAYSDVRAVWQKLDSTPQIENLTSALTRKQQQKSRKLKTACTALGMVLAIAAGAYGFRFWQTQPVMEMVASAPVGEIKSQQLEDGSKLTINAKSEIEVTYYRNKRLVKLKRGEVVFEVARDESRPFIVDSGNAKVTVLGTRFAVNRLQSLVRVSVDHGRVQVESQDQSGAAYGATIVLGNGEVAEVRTGKSPLKMAYPAANGFSFTEGIISFYGAGLEEISETLSRYRTAPVRLQTGLASDSQITAVLKPRNMEKFLGTLPDLAPVAIDFQPDQTVIIRKK